MPTSKTKSILSTLVIASLLALSLSALVSGCRTTEQVTLSPSGQVITNTVKDIDPSLAKRLAPVAQGVGTTVALLSYKADKNSAAYLKATSGALDQFVLQTDLSGVALSQALAESSSSELRSTEGQLIAQLIATTYAGFADQLSLTNRDGLILLVGSFKRGLDGGLYSISKLPR